jgi:hypothetical protein
MEGRNRLTAAFRVFLALPHLLLVGGPVAMIVSVDWSSESGAKLSSGSGGLIGAVVFLAVLVAWFAILLTARYPDPLRRLAVWYLRWRLRAIAYFTLLRDEYPPFGDDPYPTTLDAPAPQRPHSRLSVAFRLILALPHMFVLWLLSVVWAFTTAVGWAAIILTGRFPELLYGFGLGVLAWSTRVEAYLLLLRDEYPPFTLRT